MPRYTITSDGNGAVFILIRHRDGARLSLQGDDAAKLAEQLESTHAGYTDDDVCEEYDEVFDAQADDDAPRPEPFDPAAAVLIVADDVARVRGCDLFRLFDWNRTHREELARYVTTHRPELTARVAQALRDVADEIETEARESSPTGLADVER